MKFFVVLLLFETLAIVHMAQFTPRKPIVPRDDPCNEKCRAYRDQLITRHANISASSTENSTLVKRDLFDMMMDKTEDAAMKEAKKGEAPVKEEVKKFIQGKKKEKRKDERSSICYGRVFC